MKKILIALTILIALSAESQNLTSANPAKLQVYLSTMSGGQIMLSYDHLNNQFSQLTMSGDLDIRELVTEDAGIRAMLDTSTVGIIRYSTAIPEGQFVFHEINHYTFTAETEVIVGDRSSRVIINFDVSNIKTETANTFSVICSGTLSLEKDLGIIIKGDLNDQVSFQFFQNVRSLTY